MKKTKIIDVANKVGVSKSTISQYLNGRFTHMSPKTKELIRLTIEEMNYVPNAIARSLKTDKTNTIGVMVRDIAGADTSHIIRGIEDYCKTNNYNVFIESTDFDKNIEKRTLSLLKQMRVDGIIIAPSGKNNDILSEEFKSNFPIVQIHLEYDDLESSLVISDYRQGSFIGTEHLINMGHKRICLITQKHETYKSRHERFLGYTEALLKHNMPIEEDMIQFWNNDTGFANSLEDILSMPNPPTALFSMHLKITTKLLEKLNQMKVQIPEDVSVMGFDEIPMVDFFKVPITVVRQSPYELGRESAKMLFKKMVDKKRAHEKIVLPCTLMERESCKNLNS